MTMSIVGGSRVVCEEISHKNIQRFDWKRKSAPNTKSFESEKYILQWNSTATKRVSKCYQYYFHIQLLRAVVFQPVPDFINQSTLLTKKRVSKLFWWFIVFIYFSRSWRAAELELVEKQQNSIRERTQNIHKQFNFTVFFSSSRLALTHAKMLHEHFLQLAATRQVAVFQECETFMKSFTTLSSDNEKWKFSTHFKSI